MLNQILEEKDIDTSKLTLENYQDIAEILSMHEDPNGNKFESIADDQLVYISREPIPSGPSRMPIVRSRINDHINRILGKLNLPRSDSMFL